MSRIKVKTKTLKKLSREYNVESLNVGGIINIPHLKVGAYSITKGMHHLLGREISGNLRDSESILTDDEWVISRPMCEEWDI